jgi:hypothetical protein
VANYSRVIFQRLVQREWRGKVVIKTHFRGRIVVNWVAQVLSSQGCIIGIEEWLIERDERWGIMLVFTKRFLKTKQLYVL